jgi:beta-N-acetylglucosaminidase
MTRINYLICSAILVTFTLAFAHLHDLRQQLDHDLIEYIYELQEMLDQTEHENRELQEQNRELQERWARHVQARERMYVYASISRGGRHDFITMPVLSESGFTAADFERSFSGTGLDGIGAALVRAEMETGINALVLAGIIALESGWGGSRLAREKNNLAGLGAYDGQEYSAGIRFDSRASSITFLAELLAVKYAPGGKYFGGSHDLQGIGIRYASDPRWAVKVAGCMRAIVEAGR